MKTRWIPPTGALAILAACGIIWPPRQGMPIEPPHMPRPVLPVAADLPDIAEGKDIAVLFSTNKRKKSKSPVTIIKERKDAATDAPDAFRLRAYVGGDKLWVVTLEDAAGHYYTLRTGEMIPHTRLEFRGMSFRTSSKGLPEGTAIFYDNEKENYVDVIACDDVELKRANSAHN